MLETAMKLMKTFGSALLSFAFSDNEEQSSNHEKFSDGIGLYNVSNNVMTKEEVEAEEYETGLYDDY